MVVVKIDGGEIMVSWHSGVMGVVLSEISIQRVISELGARAQYRSTPPTDEDAVLP